MAVSVGSSSIVTDGLVLYLDPSVSTNYVLTEVEVLVVAGGASGGTGSNGGGGGGAGGLIYRSSYPVTTGVGITVTIGNGGSSTVGRGVGSNGQNSVFGNITATGGGAGGGSGGSSAGLAGGSGGGGMYSNAGGSGANGQGNNGGTGNYVLNGPHDAGGGGGGAGQRGEDANEDYAGRGGNGLCFSLTGTPRYYAGGGGGASNSIAGGGLRRAGAGGLGGGGRGGVNGVTLLGQSGEANTGGGGGGGVGASGGASGGGGSGVVIVRYPGPQKATGGNTITQVAGYTVHVFTTGSGTFTPTAAPANGGGINGLLDLSGNNNTTISQIGGVTYTTDNSGSLFFDGVNDAILGTITPLTGNYTVEVIFKLISFNVSDNSLLALTGSTAHGFLAEIQSSSGKIRFLHRYPYGSGGGDSFYSSGSINLNQIYSISWVRDNNQKIYINGIFDSQITSTNSAFDSSLTQLTIGQLLQNNSARIVNGNVYSTKIYNKALTESEIQQNFNAQRRRFGI